MRHTSCRPGRLAWLLLKGAAEQLREVDLALLLLLHCLACSCHRWLLLRNLSTLSRAPCNCRRHGLDIRLWLWRSRTGPRNCSRSGLNCGGLSGGGLSCGGRGSVSGNPHPPAIPSHRCITRGCCNRRQVPGLLLAGWGRASPRSSSSSSRQGCTRLAFRHLDHRCRWRRPVCAGVLRRLCRCCYWCSRCCSGCCMGRNSRGSGLSSRLRRRHSHGSG